jgi:rod shape-determining protein MreB
VSGAVALDFGSRRTRLADETGRVIYDDASLAAVNLRDGSLVAYGAKAAELIGHSAGEVGLVRPVIGGQLQDLNLTDKVATHLLQTVEDRVGRHPEVLCCLPGLASQVQRRAMEKSLKEGGAARVEFIEHAVAVGIGFRLRIEEPVATMALDAGAGRTDVAVMALGGTVTKASIPVGGDDIDRAVHELLFRSFDLVVPIGVAENVKKELVSAWPTGENKVEVTGRDASSGAPRSVVLSTSEASTAARDQLRAVIEAAVSCLVSAPPDLANDLLARGLHLAGEAALLDGLARKLATETGIPVHLSEEPALTAVKGAARCLSELAASDRQKLVRSAGPRADPRPPA